MFLPRFLLVRCKTWFGQIKLFWIMVILMHGINGCNEHSLSCPARIFVLPLSILNLWWSVNWPHIQYDNWTRRNCSESIYLSCNKGSMGLRPEWPWRARRSRISCPDGSVQHWNFFLFPPPPAILLFHTSSDQYWEYSNLFRRSSFCIQNSIAPSSSRSRSPCRRRVLSFDTG